MEAQKLSVRVRGTATAQLGPAKSWGAPIGRYLFGPAPARRAETDTVLAEIRRLGGVVAPADVMRVTGLGRLDAEALLCRVAARHGGDVGVAGQAVLYRFPALDRTRRLAPTPVWERRQEVEPITGNELPIDLALLLLNLMLLFVSGLLIVQTLPISAWQPAAALVPFLLSLLALALPLARLATRRAQRREVVQENGRRSLLRAVLERPAGKPLGAHALSHAWVIGAGRAIRPDRLLDQVRALGGEPDVDEDARLQFRFPDFDHEARAVAQLRAAR